jgi:Flp pilus assembly protein TadG
MAFALPILCMILTGIFFLSIALYQKLQLAEAVSVGGRYLAVDRGDTDPCASTALKIYASAPGLKPSSLTLNFTLNGVSSGSSCPGSSGNANGNMVPGANAQIDASYPCTLKFFNAFGTSNSTTCTIKASVVEIVQ